MQFRHSDTEELDMIGPQAIVSQSNDSPKTFTAGRETDYDELLMHTWWITNAHLEHVEFRRSVNLLENMLGAR